MANHDKAIAAATNELIADMDDTTGSNGGSTRDRFLGEETDTQDDQDQSTDFQKPQTDLKQADSTNVSGGTGDAYTAQSAGRSQY